MIMTSVSQEIELEREAVEITVEKLKEKSLKQGIVDATSVGKKTIASLVSAISAEVDVWKGECEGKRKKPIAYIYIKDIDSMHLSYITAKHVVNGLMMSEVLLTEACRRVGETIRDKVEYDQFILANPEVEKRIAYRIKDGLSDVEREKYIKREMIKVSFGSLTWEEEDVIAVGFILIKCLIEASDLVKHKVIGSGTNRKAILRPTKATREWLEDAFLKEALMTPLHFPMVIQPDPWDDLYSGGYLDKSYHGLELVRTRRKGLLRTIENVEMPEVLQGVNSIQNTPWRVNKKVLRVFRELVESNEEIAGLATPKKPVFPSQVTPLEGTSEGTFSFTDWIKDKDNKALYDNYKKDVKLAHKVSAKSISKRYVLEQQLTMADKFKDESTIYFPHTLDFRGRIYPAAGLGSMNPQGDDRGKALLQFSRGKALGETGGYWLAVHVANTWGKDKVSLDDRVLWTMFNAQDIKDYAAAPLVNLGWTKADKPWQFLAACFEYSSFLDQGDDFISHLPIALDGSCSGLQHFSAMLKDADTAEAVNVIQTGEEPNDVYNVVAEAVVEYLENSSKELAAIWLPRISRDLVKQPVMTTPYGVTSSGIINQLETKLDKLIDKGTVETLPPHIDKREACIFLGDVVSEAIGTKVSSAREAMDWLRECAHISAKHKCPVRWTTPVGFLAIQNYTKPVGKRLKLAFRGKSTRLQLNITGHKLNLSKQAAGMAPNYVHSMDASHLISTVNLAALNGIEDFAMIHDSFGTHAADTSTLAASLRYSFEVQYQGEVLVDLYRELEEQLPKEVFELIPPPPESGDLEITDVNASEFFFA